MTAFIIYLLLFCALILSKRSGNIFTDNRITKPQFTIYFLLKALAVPVFYMVYTRIYGGISEFDTGKFYHDAKIINEYGRSHSLFYLRLLLGLQDDSEGSPDYLNCLVYTQNWDNGAVKDFLYNDNRLVIRLHSLLHFIAFNSWFAHALFSCFFSFLGITFLYRAFKDQFPEKEHLLLAVMCFLPALWFYTGALLKEGVTMLLLGSAALQIRLLTGKISTGGMLRMCVIVFISLFLKPYILLSGASCFACYFVLQKTRLRYQPAIFFCTMVAGIVLVNALAGMLAGRSLVSAVTMHQQRFADASKGGLFLLDKKKFVRLNHDTTLLKKVTAATDSFTIKKNVPYTYWLLSATHDTLRSPGNTDTVTRYKLLYQIAESKSNINPVLYGHGVTSMVLTGLYYALLHPFFINAGTGLRLHASVENLLIAISLMIIVTGFVISKKQRLLPAVFIFFALCVCLLAGIATPNSGAIFRYRAPAVIFILAAALYYLPWRTGKRG